MAGLSTTKSSTLRLSDIARHVVAPAGAVSTGWPAVEKKCAEFGVKFRPWQQPVGRLILAKRADGKYASTVGGTGLSIPRQVGKTFLVGAIVFALCMLRPGLTVIWTAHRLRTAEETFGKMLAFAKRRKIAPHILKTPVGSGDEAIIFRNGSRILFGARERGFGRGFDEVDVLIFDEAQILTENALDDMIPATNQSRQETSALLLFMGTPPKPSDPGEVFSRMRSEALAGEDTDTGWIEFGADPDYKPTPAPAPLTSADWVQIAKANPSYPDDTPREAILRMRKKLGPESFLREGLGIWDAVSAAGMFSPGAWMHCSHPDREVPDPEMLGIAADVDQTWLSLGAFGDGHLGPVCRMRFNEQNAEFLAETVRIAKGHRLKVAIDKKGPAAPLIPELERQGVKVIGGGLDDLVRACTDLRTAVETAQVWHSDYPDLNEAVDAATWRPVGDRRVFGRKGTEISMLEAVTWARWAAMSKPKTKPFAIWG